MGKDLGLKFFAIWQEVAWLHSEWQEYVDLYGTSESRIELLNKAAPTFFRIVQGLLWEGVILHISRLTDKMRIAGRENLTIFCLPSLVNDENLKSKLNNLLDEIKKTTEFCRDWRNRRIAHRDLELAIEKGINPLKPANRKLVKDALKVLVNFLNEITRHYKDSETMFNIPSIQGGESLLYVIDNGLRADEERKNRFKSGDYSVNNSEPRKL